ncbi:MAG: hypothetical protein K2X47_19535 [Bdellovibrionales bacterium]|nr:hypothetical protein [Bdellovibrionales bacterium]
MIKGILGVFALVLISGVSFADEFSLPQATTSLEVSGRDGALQQMDLLAQSEDLDKLKVQVGSAIDAILKAAIQNLRSQGHHQYANQIESEWTQSYSLYFFGGLSLMDLGDHDPLVPWLANVMGNLEKKGGRGIMQKTRIYDLKVINYALPVVFAPAGSKRTGKAWGQEEYGKHFIPLMGVTTYWTTRIACKVLAKNQPIVSRFCSTIAGVAEKVVVKRVAPKMSNSIYINANKKRRAA